MGAPAVRGPRTSRRGRPHDAGDRADPGRAVVPGAVPVLPGPAAARSFQGPLTAGTVFASVAPAGDWQLAGASGATAARTSAFGWASRYAVPARTVGTLRFGDGFLPLLVLVFSVLAWGLAVAAWSTAVGSAGSGSGWAGPAAGRRVGRGTPTGRRRVVGRRRGDPVTGPVDAPSRTGPPAPRREPAPGWPAGRHARPAGARPVRGDRGGAGRGRGDRRGVHWPPRRPLRPRPRTADGVAVAPVDASTSSLFCAHRCGDGRRCRRHPRSC